MHRDYTAEEVKHALGTVLFIAEYAALCGIIDEDNAVIDDGAAAQCKSSTNTQSDTRGLE